MTVRIGEMTAEFANANTTFVAIGMEVNDLASNNNSMLLNFNVNDKSVFSVNKTGKTTINANNSNLNAELFNVKSSNNEIIKVTPNVAKVNTTAYIKSYSEGYQTLSGSSLVLNLAKASIFGTNQSSISSIQFQTPSIETNETKVFSCSLVLFNSATFGGSVWSNAGVIWSGGLEPTNLTGPTVLTFMNISSAPSVWYGVISGQNYA